MMIMITFILASIAYLVGLPVDTSISKGALHFVNLAPCHDDDDDYDDNDNDDDDDDDNNNE